MTDRRARTAVWAGFAVVHGWLAFVGVVLAPRQAFHDVDLYRWWMDLGLNVGLWPVFDGPWVYPVGAIVPMALPGLGSATSTTGYAIGWCLLVTLLNGAAVSALLRRGRTGAFGAGWWLAFIAALGPVAMGRLDGVIAPVMVLALVVAVERPRVAAALMTVGAWIKVAPGILVLPLAASTRRPVRDVVLPAAAVCAVVVGAVAALGGGEHLLSFLTQQSDRRLQVESVAATPWAVLRAIDSSDAVFSLNQSLVTWEVASPAATSTARVLDVALVLAVGAAGVLLWWAGARGRHGAALLPGALLMLTLLVVFNKVGSPQFLTWLAPPVAVAIARSGPASGAGPGTAVGRRVERWVPVAAVLGLVAAALTQVVFPWGYEAYLEGHAGVTAALVVRNALIVALAVVVARALVAVAREPEDARDQPA